MTRTNTRDGVEHSRDELGTQSLRAAELSRLVDSVPPHALEAEMSLLGSMLFEPKTIADVILIVKNGQDFHRPAHGRKAG